MDYCTVQEIKADMPDSPLSSTSTYDATLRQMATDASRLIDALVGRWPNYFAGDDSEVRYYDGNGEAELCIDEAVSVSAVAVAEQGGVTASDYTSWSSSDWYQWPSNYVQLSEPIRKLIVDYWNGSKTYWQPYRKAVKVTGVFGWSSTPPAIINRAARIQSVRWFMRAKQGYQDASASPELGQMLYVRELDPDVKTLIHKWMIENNL